MDYRGAPGLEFGDGNTRLDPSVAKGDLLISTDLDKADFLKALPEGSKVIATDAHGISFWANTGRLDVELAGGSPHAYFIKVISNDVGLNMPIAYGTYETIPDTHFYICDFREMIDDMPDPHRFTTRLAALHQKSRSPEGKFGSEDTTFNGNLPQLGGWEASWETYFSKSMRLALDLEIKAKGHDTELDNLIPTLFDKVIPRLLRPLESEGRSVKPSLVHGDLWYANSGIDVNTGDPIIFDACSFYAHNEC
ncbi:uncharacterized protein KY384_002429 [Bacidia gigantensis]|uniref:uncharacterized protein n=1 Tax=Bacidia gigantensis TaxID=2732470 RepID=UPI001D04F75C|nr:uncharacterized protein KY384_002429 [Bacidia gigantensis]KAG8532552.1 hypothetical protein KY384_002429 [Bacidia gigantensis]